MIRRPPRSTLSSSSAASDVYKRQGLCADAGTAPVCGGHQLRKSAGLDTAGTLPETGCEGRCLSAAHGHTLAPIVPVSDHLPAHGPGTGSIAWIERHCSTERHPDWTDEATAWESPVPKPLLRRRQMPIMLVATSGCNKSLRRRRFRQSRAAQNAVRYAFMN